MATTTMSIDGWFKCSSGAFGKTEHCGVLRSTYRKTFDVGRGSPLDRCRHERRTGDTKKNLTRASQPQHHVNVNVQSLSQ